MPDPDFNGLRTTLHDSVQQPPVSDVIRRAHRRSTRRRLQLASAAVVVLALAVVPLVRMGTQRDTVTPVSPSDQNFVVSMDFYNLTNGFALGGSCEHRPICDAWVMATGDAGAWEKRSAPPVETGFSGQPDRLVALSTTKLIIDDHRAGNVVKRFFSGDGARTWQEVPVTGGAPHNRIGSSAIVECRSGKVSALLPDNGTSAELATQPPFDVTSCQPYPDVHARWWVTGKDRTTGKPMVASTKDGETWTVSALPAFTPPPAEQITSADYPAVSITTSLTAVYATVTNPGGDPADLVAIFRSADSGVTWEQTWQASDNRQPASISGIPVAGTDGTLRISQYPRSATEVWISADGGKTFTAEPSDSAADVRPIRSGYLGTRSDSASTGAYLTSYDGIRWNRTRMPFP